MDDVVGSVDAENAVIRVEDLWHQYSDAWALKGLNFSLTGNGVIGLLGSNGAGKSTLMNIICGCLSQTKGLAEVDGMDVRAHPLEVRRKIGFLPQQAPLSFELTIEEYLRFCAGLRGMGKKAAVEAVEDVMERCDLSSMRNRLIGNLSGGYRQRTGIAQAVVHRPRLVVLDEPTVGLDPNQILGVRDLILDIGKEHTVVFSTHILPEVEAMCREVLMVERGQIVFHNDMDAFRTVVEPNAVILVGRHLPSPADLKGAVSEISNVERAGSNKVRVYHCGGRAIASKLWALGADKGWDVEELYFERSSLEDVFATLSKESGS